MATRRFWLALGLAAGACLAQTPDANKPAPSKDESVQTPRHRRIRLGGISVGAGYAHYSGYFPAFYRPFSYYPYLFDDFLYPGLYAPYLYHPYYSTGFVRGPNMGEVKLHTEARDAEVFVDGAYAGTAGDLKNMWLEPGAYNLEVKSAGRRYARRIYVLSGKSLKIDARLEPQAPEVKP